MTYKEFNTRQFVEDKYFIDWVLKPNVHSRKFWQSFLGEYPEKAMEIQMAREIVMGINYKEKPELGDEAYVQLFDRILESSRKLRQAPTQRKRKKDRSLTFLRYAAVLLIGLGTLAFWYLVDGSLNETDYKSKLTVVECPPGSHITTLLADGTRVQLNGNSKITYYKPFSDTVRSVFLVGEAFFEVTKDHKRPFRVETEYISTEVLGTSFSVKAYPDEKKASVAVKEGKVRVSNTNNTNVQFKHTLLPFQGSQLNIETNNSEKYELENESVFDWTEWKFVFKNEPLGEVLRKMERWYAIQFEFGKGVNLSEAYTGKFDNEPFTVILDAFESQGAFDYRLLNGRKVLISKQKKE